MKGMRDMENTFWANNSRLTAHANALQELIPAFGEVKYKNKNPALEDFRKMSNAYDRFYNDGASYGKIWRLFDKYGVERPPNFSDAPYLPQGKACNYLETLAEKIVEAAAKEQGIVVAPHPDELVIDSAPAQMV